MKSNRFSQSFGFIGFLTLLLISFFPKQSAQGISEGLSLCTNRIVPALFPFFVVSNLLMSTSAAYCLGMIAYPYVRFALGFRTSKEISSALVLSWLGGFAVSACVISQLYEKNRISHDEAAVLLCCSIGASPAFVINTIGLLILGNIQMGISLFVSLMTANLICGIIAARIYKTHSSKTISANVQPHKPAPSISIIDSIRMSVQAMLSVCGIVIFFSGISSCLEAISPKSPICSFILKSSLEVTSGCVAGAQLSKSAAPFACCFALSILSFSVLIQVRALLSPKISLLPLLLIRPLHLSVSLLTFCFILHFAPNAVSAASTFSSPVIPQNRLEPDSAFVLFCLAVVVLCFTSNKQWDIIKSRNLPRSCDRKDEV